MKHRYHFNFSPFWVFTLLLLLTMGILLGGVVTATRAQQTEYACLRFTGIEPGADLLLDTRNGLSVRDARPLPAEQTTSAFGEWRSPDGKQIAYTRTDPNLSRLSMLYVQPADQPISPANAQTLGEKITVMALGWSPDSRHLVYIWRGNRGDLWVTLLNAQTGQSRSQVIATALRREAAFYGWSADGTYFALGSEDSFGRTVTYWSVDTFRPVSFPQFGFLNFIEHTAWSPTKRRFAYIRTDFGSRARLVIAALDANDPTRLGENSLEMPYPNPLQIVWSPNGDYLAMRYLDKAGWQLVIYRPGVVEPEEVFRVQMGGPNLWPRGYAWAPDSRSLVFWKAESTRASNPQNNRIVAYRIDSGRIETLVESPVQNRDPFGDLDSRPFPGGRIPLVYPQGDRFAVDLMEVDGTQRETIVTGAIDLNHLYWSPDRNAMILQWSTRNGNASEPRLTIVEEAENNRLEITLGRYVIDSVRWIGNRRAVFTAYSSIGNGEFAYRVGLLHLATGEIQPLGQGYTRIMAVSYSQATETILYWVQKGKTTWGLEAYAPNGQTRFTFSYESSEEADPVLLEGLIHRSFDDTRMLFFHGQRFVPYLLGPNGQFTQLTDDSIPPMKAVWSPEGSRIALMYGGGGPTGAVSVRLFAGDGQFLREVRDLPVTYDAPFWTRCD